MEAETRIRWIDLQVESRHLHSLLLVASQTRETVSKGVGNARKSMEDLSVLTFSYFVLLGSGESFRMNNGDPQHHSWASKRAMNRISASGIETAAADP